MKGKSVGNIARFLLHFGCKHSKYVYCYNLNILSRATEWTRRSFDASEVKIELYDTILFSLNVTLNNVKNRSYIYTILNMKSTWKTCHEVLKIIMQSSGGVDKISRAV